MPPAHPTDHTTAAAGSSLEGCHPPTQQNTKVRVVTGDGSSVQLLPIYPPTPTSSDGSADMAARMSPEPLNPLEAIFKQHHAAAAEHRPNPPASGPEQAQATLEPTSEQAQDDFFRHPSPTPNGTGGRSVSFAGHVIDDDEEDGMFSDDGGTRPSLHMESCGRQSGMSAGSCRSVDRSMRLVNRCGGARSGLITTIREPYSYCRFRYMSYTTGMYCIPH